MMATLNVEVQKTNTDSEIKPRLMLEITRVIRASRAQVFEAWTHPEILRQWFGPGNMTIPSATLDVRAGGEYGIQMAGSSGTCEDKAEEDANKIALVQGTYQQVVLNELLQFTWHPEWDPTEASLVTVSLRDVEGGTELKLTHEKFASERSRDGHEKGWSSSLSKLARVIEG
jgi:uncharacterized protein YndB with AHSA1/START domain